MSKRYRCETNKKEFYKLHKFKIISNVSIVIIVDAEEIVNILPQNISYIFQNPVIPCSVGGSSCGSAGSPPALPAPVPMSGQNHGRDEEKIRSADLEQEPDAGEGGPGPKRLRPAGKAGLRSFALPVGAVSAAAACAASFSAIFRRSIGRSQGGRSRPHAGLRLRQAPGAAACLPVLWRSRTPPRQTPGEAANSIGQNPETGAADVSPFPADPLPPRSRRPVPAEPLTWSMDARPSASAMEHPPL